MTVPARFVSSEGFNVDAAEEEDLPRITDYLYRLYAEEAEMNQEALAVDAYRLMTDEVRTCFGRSGRIYLVLKWRDEVCGFLHIMDRENSDYITPVHIGWICELYVEEGFRNAGAGSALLEAAKMWCKERGLYQIELSCNINNIAAREWYEKREFTATYQVMKMVFHV